MKFIATRELGRLCKWLRIFGYDCAYYRDDNLSTLLITAMREERIIVTRHSHLKRHPGVEIIQIKSDVLAEQIKQLESARGFKPDEAAMFSRCTVCNNRLEPAEKESLKTRVPEYVFKTQERFYICPACQRVYWQGTHWGNVREYLKEVESRK